MEKRLSVPPIWREIDRSNHRDLATEHIFDSILSSFFHIGDFYSLLFDLEHAEFRNVSKSVQEVLGFPPQEITLKFWMSLIHPDDLPYFVAFEKKVVGFMNGLSANQIKNYKVRYDIRLRHKAGNYVRILHQMIAVLAVGQKQISHSLCVHTDITYLKADGVPLLSFIGINGEPSFVDVFKEERSVLPKSNKLTAREKEIVDCLMIAMKTPEIADKLNLSQETVKTHRKNILKKLNLHSTIDLMAYMIKEGLV